MKLFRSRRRCARGCASRPPVGMLFIIKSKASSPIIDANSWWMRDSRQLACARLAKNGNHPQSHFEALSISINISILQINLCADREISKARNIFRNSIIDCHEVVPNRGANSITSKMTENWIFFSLIASNHRKHSEKHFFKKHQIEIEFLSLDFAFTVESLLDDLINLWCRSDRVYK